MSLSVGPGIGHGAVVLRTCEARLAWQAVVVVPKHLVVTSGIRPSKIVVAVTPKSASAIVDAKAQTRSTPTTKATAQAATSSMGWEQSWWNRS